MKTVKLLLIITLIFTCSGIFATTVHQWEVYRLTFHAKKNYQNPYLLIPASDGKNLLEVHFKGSGGDAEGHQLTISGCWNGGDEWIVNFTAPYSGSWEYISESPDKGLDRKKGKLEVIKWTEAELQANPTRRGFIQVHPEDASGTHYFEYADGTPFLWIGDTWWNWTDNRIHLETFKKLVDNRAEKGFNIGQLFVPGNGWGQISSLLDSTFTQLDPEHVKKVEDMIRYANSKGITVWIHGWWSRKNLNETVGEEKIKRWWSYLIDRFGAYNVIWVLAGEYNMYNYGGFPLEFWKELGQFVKQEDPYTRIVSVHSTPPFWDGGAEAPQWSTGDVLHQENWLDYNQSQVGHGRYANEMIPKVIEENYAGKPAKPIVITEPWYEFVEGNPTGRDIRLAAWGAILSGAAGHTYGGGHVWRASTPETGADSGDAWPKESGFERTTYDYEGAVSMGIMSKFFSNIDWWNMQPHAALITDSPQPFCLAIPGKEYVIYLRYGGYMTVKLNAQSNGQYSYYFMNPATGEKSQVKDVHGAESIHLTCPGMYPGSKKVRDWVIYIKKMD